MDLKYVTFTGLDEGLCSEEGIARVRSLSERYPFVEWGILYSDNRAGRGGRYPSKWAIDRFTDALGGLVNLSLHLCGDSVFDALYRRGPAHELALVFMSRPRTRIQLNFRLPTDPIEGARLLARLGDFIGRSRVPVITQYNEHNRNVVAGPGHHHVLFDASGGKGETPDEYQEPTPGRLCGYAGGLGPGNILREVPRIVSVAREAEVWIDMESGVRDRVDRMSLAKVEAVLQGLSSFCPHDIRLPAEYISFRCHVHRHIGGGSH